MLLTLATAGSARADLTGYTSEKLAFEGDPAPGGGILNQMVGEIDIEANGRVVFVSYTWHGISGAIRIFAVEGDVLTTPVSEGDAAPDTGGLLFVDVNRPRIAAPQVLGYLGLYDDAGDTRWGGFLRDGATDIAVALPGTSAPGGGSIDKVLYVHTATATPSLAFGAHVDAGGVDPIAAHFVHEPTALREIYRDGGSAPAAVGGTFSGVQAWWPPALEADGTTTFYSRVSGGSVTSGIFQASPANVVTPLLLEGAALTTPGGGTFIDFAQSVDANDAGDLVINADVLRPPSISSFQGIFVLEGGVQREVIYRGDPLPGTSPPRFYLGLAGSGAPALDGAGNVAFAASLTDDLENVVERAIVVSRSGELAVLLKEGDPVPGIPGDVFTDFPEVRVDETGRIAFYGFTTTGTGVFLATPAAPAVTAAPPLALAALALGIAMAAGRARRASR